MRKITGSAMVDYIIPTAVVGLLLGLGIYGFTSDGYLQKFLIASGNMNKSINDGQLIVGNNNSEAGSLGGTPEAPVIKCQMGNICDIDYGTFLLKGVPSDFDEFIETNGNSGGTEKLLEILESMAEQIKDSDPRAYTKLKDLANFGHIMGDIQKTTEAKAISCKDDTDPKLCFRNWLNGTHYNLPPEFNTYLPNYDSSTTSTEMMLSFSFMGFFKASYFTPHSSDKTTYPGAAAIQAYENISGDTIPQNIKNVSKELYRSLNDIGQNIYGISSSLNESYQYTYQYIDPIDGTPGDIIKYNSSSMDDVTNPNSSILSHGDSYIICKEGRNSDSGSSCK